MNLAASIKTSNNKVFISGLVIREDKLNKKDNEVNQLLKKNVELGSCRLLITRTLAWLCGTKVEFIGMSMAPRVLLTTFALV